MCRGACFAEKLFFVFTDLELGLLRVGRDIFCEWFVYSSFYELIAIELAQITLMMACRLSSIYFFAVILSNKCLLEWVSDRWHHEKLKMKWSPQTKSWSVFAENVLQNPNPKNGQNLQNYTHEFYNLKFHPNFYVWGIFWGPPWGYFPSENVSSWRTEFQAVYWLSLSHFASNIASL